MSRSSRESKQPSKQPTSPFGTNSVDPGVLFPDMGEHCRHCRDGRQRLHRYASHAFPIWPKASSVPSPPPLTPMEVIMDQMLTCNVMHTYYSLDVPITLLLLLLL